MPRTTLVAGTPITAAWANANVRDQVVTPFASAAARSAAVTSPIAGMVTYLTDVDRLEVYSGGAWVSQTWAAAEVLGSQNTTSSTYTDLGTVGPTVTMNTGAKALVIVSALASNNGTNFCNMSVAVSGATTIAAADDNAMSHYSPAANITAAQSALVYLASLNAGSNTFTAKYRTNAGTATFATRRIAVVGIM